MQLSCFLNNSIGLVEGQAIRCGQMQLSCFCKVDSLVGLEASIEPSLDSLSENKINDNHNG